MKQHSLFGALFGVALVAFLMWLTSDFVGASGLSYWGRRDQQFKRLGDCTKWAATADHASQRSACFWLISGKPFLTFIYANGKRIHVEFGAPENEDPQ